MSLASAWRSGSRSKGSNCPDRNAGPNATELPGRRKSADQHQRAERGLADHPDPELAETGAGALATALDEAARQQHGVDRAGAGAADGIDVDVGLFQQPVQHAPGKGGKAAAALQAKRQFSRRPNPGLGKTLRAGDDAREGGLLVDGAGFGIG